MKQDVFTILLYLFENYIYDDSDVEPDHESLNRDLLAAGFRQNEISKAFNWLEGLTTTSSTEITPGASLRSLRVYSGRECERLTTQCRGFILFLEQMGVLDPTMREMVIDRVMALESKDVDLDHIKWVVLMVLFNQPGQEAAVAWMEELVFDEVDGYLH